LRHSLVKWTTITGVDSMSEKKTKSAGDIGGSIRDVQHNLTVTEFGGVLATTEALPHIFTLQL